jgi:hypothetical protein
VNTAYRRDEELRELLLLLRLGLLELLLLRLGLL